jgi:hypothetical protein
MEDEDAGGAHVRHVVQTRRRQWLNPKEKHWGAKRFHAMLRMLIYLRLALHCRYRERLNRKSSKLDEVFAIFLELEVDSVRKIRQRMTRFA